jgi:arylformamidase
VNHPNAPLSIDRRSLLAGIAAIGVVCSVTSATAQSATDKPAKVWLDMDQKALGDAYDHAKYAPNFQQVIKRYASISDAMLARVGEPKRVAYGPSAIEKLDIFSPKQASAPIHIHIHGGACRQRPASHYVLPGVMLMHAGAPYVVPNFISVDESNGNLASMVEQMRRSNAWTIGNAASFEMMETFGDPYALLGRAVLEQMQLRSI